jgi:hypothetical protein
VPRPIATRTQRIAAGVLVVVVLLVVLARLGPGPAAIHDLPLLSSTITVCDCQYHGGSLVRSLADVAVAGESPVLVDPGPFGLVPSCPGPNPDGDRPCSRDPSAGPCATVVYVRVGADAYAAYELSGGP